MKYVSRLYKNGEFFVLGYDENDVVQRGDYPAVPFKKTTPIIKVGFILNKYDPEDNVFVLPEFVSDTFLGSKKILIVKAFTWL